MQIDHMKAHLAEILLRDNEALRLLMAMLSLLLGTGFLCLGDNFENDYKMLYELMPAWAWGVLFYSCGVVKICSLWTSVANKLVPAMGAIELWSWLYLLLSFTVFDTEPMEPAELLLTVPLICEVWSVAYLIFERNSSGK